MNLLDLGGTFLITGGAGAIGRVVAHTLAEHGATVVVNDVLPESELVYLQNDPFAARLHYVQADITEPKGVTSLFDRAETIGGLPHTVLCHAGMTHAAPIESYPLERFDALLNLNLRAAFLVAQEASRRWLAAKKPGHLIFTGSWVEAVPWPEITPYNASKAALKMLMRGFARELAPTIRANAVAPGIVDAGLAKAQWESDPSYKARAKRAIPLGRLQPLESLAHTFLFLCSPMAGYMTGTTLLVDGGASLYPMDPTDEET